MTALTADGGAAAEVELIALSESALRISSDSGDRERDWRLVHHLAADLVDRAGFINAVPTYEAVLIEFDADRLGATEAREIVTASLAGIDVDAPVQAHPRHFRVPVVYGGTLGPDLEQVAELTGLPVHEVIARHSAPIYTIRCLGAPGGSPMLDGPDLGVSVPRLASPRPRVPQGAISLAGRQATLTPAEAPGGWCVIGRTPLGVLDLSREPLVPYRPGDTLSFFEIDADAYERLCGTYLAPEAAA